MKEDVIGTTIVNGEKGDIRGYNVKNGIPKGDKRPADKKSLFKEALQRIDSIIPKGEGNSYDYLKSMSKTTAPTSKAVKDAKKGCEEQKKRGWGGSPRKGGR